MQNSNTKLIVGLGNPGKLYVNNRHNVGFRCIDFFARKEGILLNQRRSRSRLGVGEVAGTRVILAKPRTFMNLSGQAVAPLLRYYQIQLQGLIVIYDDLDLPLGKIRIREHGGAGGHNGIKSIIGHLGRQDFARIRVPRGRPGPLNTSLAISPPKRGRLSATCTPGLLPRSDA